MERDTDAAFETYRRLVGDTAGTRWEAVMVQHLGKAEFAAGEFGDAQKSFERAWQLRIAAGAEAALVESSRRAALRAVEEAGRDGSR